MLVSQAHKWSKAHILGQALFRYIFRTDDGKTYKMQFVQPSLLSMGLAG